MAVRVRLIVAMGSEIVAFESAEWGPATVRADDLDLLSELTSLPVEECLLRLRRSRLEDMARAWRLAAPVSSREVRAFYESAEEYLWELVAWTGSADYKLYLDSLRLLADRWPPAEHPRALDYGAGVGTAALRLASLGYRVTLADVPGPALAFAQARLARREVSFDVIEIVEDVPAFKPRCWDVLVCYDVLEHVADPAAVAKSLFRSLQSGGGAALVTAFTDDERWPHHLPANYARFGGERWNAYLHRLGVEYIEWPLYVNRGRAVGAWRGTKRFLRAPRCFTWVGPCRACRR